jgi:hypothetical protein
MGDIKEDSVVLFNSECVRKKANWSKPSNKYKLDNTEFDPDQFYEDISKNSPKLKTLLDKIDRLDESDLRSDGTLYKHFIFCDLKSGNYGAKMLASALIAKGMTMGYTAELKKSKKDSSKSKTKKGEKSVGKSEESIGEESEDEDSDAEGSNSLSSDSSKSSSSNSSSASSSMSSASSTMSKGGAKLYNKLEFLDDKTLDRSKNKNFHLLSSVAVYDQPISVVDKKRILQQFNERPDNIHGKNIRFIIMDSGFKEGIDLFDIKYVHIFEPPVNAADQKQVIGRGTRTCGQKGLTFHPTRGWPLYVFIYDMAIPETMKSVFLDSDSAFYLYLKSLNFDLRLFQFTNDLEKLAIQGSVDYELNQNIHNFSTSTGGDLSGGDLSGGDLSGGEKGNKLKFPEGRGGGKGEPPVPPIVKEFGLGPKVQDILFQNPVEKMGHDDMRKYIQRNFADTAWDPAKMENLCEEKKGGGIITYSPTQDFVRRYFTPRAPVKGMLLWHSVGTGKTCSAIAAATSTFEPEGYTILWVTRTTLKNDIWKNMFDQICSETIRKRILEEGLEIPKEQSKRMKLLSKSWKIRPMSYKQFSNLVSKENNFYKTLVGINGTEDPLRKTLLIIDEAHKLYGGGDLSSIERPDMKALHKALMHSYQVSGENSARLLLMTATPITENAMELVQLMNLCRPTEDQLPADFTTFSQDYLDENGAFHASGRTQFLDQIAGHISYLNREKDARQFSQPVIEKVMTPIVKDVADVLNIDKKFARGYYNADIDRLKHRILEKNNSIDAELKDLDASRFYELKEKCDDFEGPLHKKCNQIANANIRALIKEAKNHTAKIKEDIKEIRGEIKNKRLFKANALQQISEAVDQNPDEFDAFKKTAYYQLKYKCSKKKRLTNSDLESTYPEIMELNRELDDHNEHIHQLNDQFGAVLNKHKQRIQKIRRTLRGNVSPLEKNVLKLVLKDANKTHNLGIKEKKKILTRGIGEVNKTKKAVEKKKKTVMSKINRTIKKQIRETKKVERDTERVEKKLRKTLRKQGELKEEIKNELLKDLVHKYSETMDSDLQGVYSKMEEKEEIRRQKEQVALEKAKLKEEKAKAILRIKEEKAKAKEEKEKLKKEKAKEKEEKAKAKEQTRKEKEKAKEEKHRKTQKNV